MNELAHAREICKDIRDLAKQDRDGFDAVVHLAALSNDPLGDRSGLVVNFILCCAIDLVALSSTMVRIYVKSDGTPWRPIVHIRDISAAVLAVRAGERRKTPPTMRSSMLDGRKLSHP